MSRPGPRWRPAFPFTVLSSPGVLTLVAGEDQRWALRGEGLETWLPGLLERLDGRPLEEALAPLEPGLHEAARALLEGLAGERLLREADAEELHAPRPFHLLPEGTGPLLELLGGEPEGRGAPLRVHCQDRLDYHALEAFAQECRAQGQAALWVSTGPGRRGLVSPVQLPEGGACLGCLLAASQRRSPAPELYDLLREHAAAGGAVAPAAFPAEALGILAGLARQKAARLAAEPVDPVAFRLHVLELRDLEVRAYPVPRDPDCRGCGPG